MIPSGPPTTPAPAPASSTVSVWEGPIRANDVASPATMSLTPLRPPTGTGALRSVWVPSPTSLWMFLPQARTVPSPSRAMLWYSPPASDVTPERPEIAPGLGTHPHPVIGLVVPSPSCPNLFPPQACGLPSPRRARLWWFPAEAADTGPGRPPGAVGPTQTQPGPGTGAIAVPSPTCPN